MPTAFFLFFRPPPPEGRKLMTFLYYPNKPDFNGKQRGFTFTLRIAWYLLVFGRPSVHFFRYPKRRIFFFAFWLRQIAGDIFISAKRSWTRWWRYASKLKVGDQKKSGSPPLGVQSLFSFVSVIFRVSVIFYSLYVLFFCVPSVRGTLGEGFFLVALAFGQDTLTTQEFPPPNRLETWDICCPGCCIYGWFPVVLFGFLRVPGLSVSKR